MLTVFQCVGVQPVCHISWNRASMLSCMWGGRYLRSSFGSLSGPGALPFFSLFTVCSYTKSVSCVLRAVGKLGSSLGFLSWKASCMALGWSEFHVYLGWLSWSNFPCLGMAGVISSVK